MKIGYLGPEASFTFSAASQAFPNEELISYQSIPACIRAVKQGKIPWAVVPIENTIEGSVHSTLDQLYHEADIPVQAEIVLPIQQQFMVHKSRANSWQKITKIISHPQAIAQSQAFLEEYFPNAQIEVAPSTAYGAQMVSEHPEEAIAAIGPISGASKYQLQIVAENIQDLKINQTRFWVIGHKPINVFLPAIGEKLSLALTMPNNQPGALHKALAAFGWREISLSKIESRPLKTHLGEYFFLIDVQLDRPKELIENALTEISLIGGTIKRFGDYCVYQASEVKP